MERKKRNFNEVTYSIIRSNDNVVELDISKDDDPSLLEDKLKILLEKNMEGKPNLILGILISVNEVVDNILEHSEGGEFKEYNIVIAKAGIVSAQYDEEYNNLVVTIWDFGEGIIDTLSQAYSNLSPKEVLLKAFELNTTRHKEVFPTRGNGLAKLKEFVLKSNSSISCQVNGFKIQFSASYPEGYINEEIEKRNGTYFTITINCSSEVNIYPIFKTDVFEDFFESDEDAECFLIKEFMPLNCHQQGIKIKKLILEKIKESDKPIKLDFDEVEIFTDSFIQQITTILSTEISFDQFKQKIRFVNLNNSLMGIVQEKIYIASNL